ncbi:MAG: histidinol-phosphate transaminase [Clostridia bacterium]|nr:histidinol-phosphate transaminase [Clostridia bacterium]
MSQFLDERYSALAAYVPGEQPQDKKYIKLNTNESPFPPSQAVLEAVNESQVELLRLYPDPDGRVLTKKLADYYGVEENQVFLANGSDDILNFAFMAYGANGRKSYFADITYGFYSVFANLHLSDYTEIPLKDDFTIDVDKFCGVDGIVFIANPNAPTGIALTISEVEQIVSSNPASVVVIDEAYVDFGAQSAVSLVNKYSNLLVVQTYSKSRSMAGARLGFAIGSKEIINDLHKLRYSTNPYNINRLTLVAGEKTIDTQSYYDDNCQKIIDARCYTKAELEKLGFRVLESQANFLFAESDEIDGGELYLRLKESGILVRHFTSERIKNFNRITIGTQEQMEILVKTIKQILEAN